MTSEVRCIGCRVEGRNAGSTASTAIEALLFVAAADVCAWTIGSINVSYEVTRG